MRKLIILLALIVVAMVSMAADRTGVIRTGKNTINSPFALNASDTINESDTVTFTITNIQPYSQNQVFTIGLDSVSGTPGVTITAYGKVTSSGSWVAIGSAITWTSDSNDGSITSTSPINYNYLKVEFISDATDQQTLIDVFQVKTSNAFSIPASSGTLTVSRSDAGTVTITSADNDANAALTVAAGGTGALTLGDAGSTTAITSSDWAIGATGAMTGIGAITADGLITANAGVTLGAGDDLIGSSTSDITINTDKFTVAGATGNTLIAGTLDADGVSTFSSATPIVFDGTVTKGLNFASVTPSFTDADNAWFAAGTWNDAIEISSQTEHFVPIQVNLKSKSSIAKDIAAARFRVNTDAVGGTANTLTNVNVLEMRSKLEVNTGSHANLQVSTEVSENITNTGDLLVGYFSLQGDGNITSGNHVNVLEATNTHTGTGVDNVAHFTENGTGGTITNILKVEGIAGTATNLAALVNTGATVTSGLDISGTLTNDIVLQNDETIANSTDGTVAVSGVLSANLRAATIVVNTDESETLTAAQSGAFVTFDGAGTATIPDPSAATIGVIYYLLQTADADLIVTSTTADNNAFIADNVATSDAVTMTGAGHKLGGGMMVVGVSATKWFCVALNPESELTPEAAD